MLHKYNVYAWLEFYAAPILFRLYGDFLALPMEEDFSYPVQYFKHECALEYNH